MCGLFKRQTQEGYWIETAQASHDTSIEANVCKEDFQKVNEVTSGLSGEIVQSGLNCCVCFFRSQLLLTVNLLDASETSSIQILFELQAAQEIAMLAPVNCEIRNSNSNVTDETYNSKDFENLSRF